MLHPTYQDNRVFALLLSYLINEMGLQVQLEFLQLCLFWTVANMLMLFLEKCLMETSC